MAYRRVVMFGTVAVLALAWTGQALAAEQGDFTRWNEIRSTLYGAKPIADGTGIIELDSPKRAEEAASVPVVIRALIPQTKDNYIAKLTLIVDENPAPVVATFITGPDNGNATIGTRIRVNDFSNIHVVGEMSDGRLIMVTKYIKSIGGCSAQPLSDQNAAKARLGRMRLDQPDPVKLGEPSEFTFVLGHPNNSGLQFDQITRNYIPAYYVTHAEVTFNGARVLTVEPNISIAEDPTFTFSYVVEKPGDMKVWLEDTSHAVFTSSYRVVPGPGS